MFSFRDLFLTLLATVVLGFIITFFYFSYQSSDPSFQRFQRINALNNTLPQATQGANPAVNGALLQTYACVQKGYTEGNQHAFDQEYQRLTVWDPCVQQGVLRLDQGGFHADVPNLRQRLGLLDTAVSKL